MGIAANPLFWLAAGLTVAAVLAVVVWFARGTPAAPEPAPERPPGPTPAEIADRVFARLAAELPALDIDAAGPHAEWLVRGAIDHLIDEQTPLLPAADRATVADLVLPRLPGFGGTRPTE